MTLEKRIIPCLDVDVNKGRVVKGTKFTDLRDVNDPVELAKYYVQEKADELVFLDITASTDNRGILLQMVQRVAAHVSIPFTVGGGIRDIETMDAVLRSGADKISINTAAVKNPELIRQGAEEFGSQRIVLAVDVKQTAPNKWEVVTYGGNTSTGLDAIEWLKKGQELGAGEILLTSKDRDGMKNGYDCALHKAVAEAIDLPVVASGGGGNLEHISAVLKYCDAALLASVLHFKELTISQIKDYLKKQGFQVR